MKLWYYNNKHDYETNAEVSLNNSVIDMHYFTYRSLRDSDGTFKIFIEPDGDIVDDKDKYSMICDHEDEFDKWISAFDMVVAGARAVVGQQNLGDGFVDIK